MPSKKKVPQGLERVRQVFGQDFNPAQAFVDRGLTNKGIFGAVRVGDDPRVFTLGQGGPQHVKDPGAFKNLFGTLDQSGIVGNVSAEQAGRLGIEGFGQSSGGNASQRGPIENVIKDRATETPQDRFIASQPESPAGNLFGDARGDLLESRKGITDFFTQAASNVGQASAAKSKELGLGKLRDTQAGITKNINNFNSLLDNLQKDIDVSFKESLVTGAESRRKFAAESEPIRSSLSQLNRLSGNVGADIRSREATLRDFSGQEAERQGFLGQAAQAKLGFAEEDFDFARKQFLDEIQRRQDQGQSDAELARELQIGGAQGNNLEELINDASRIALEDRQLDTQNTRSLIANRGSGNSTTVDDSGPDLTTGQEQKARVTGLDIFTDQFIEDVILASGLSTEEMKQFVQAYTQAQQELQEQGGRFAPTLDPKTFLNEFKRSLEGGGSEIDKLKSNVKNG